MWKGKSDRLVKKNTRGEMKNGRIKIKRRCISYTITSGHISHTHHKPEQWERSKWREGGRVVEGDRTGEMKQGKVEEINKRPGAHRKRRASDTQLPRRRRDLKLLSYWVWGRDFKPGREMKLEVKWKGVSRCPEKGE